MAVKENNKGFTMMEMLIVVGFIAVIVAIMIPVLNNGVTRAQRAADMAAIETAYAKAIVALFDDKEKGEAISDPLQSDNEMLDFLNREQPIYTEKGRKVKVTVYPEGKVQWEIY